MKNKMNNQTRMQRMLNFIKRGIIWTVLGVLLLAIAGTIYQTAASEADQRNFPPPGNLIDVDGYKMHIYCLGTGSPTIILDHVGGGSSMDWALIQPKLAEHTRVCAYDRAGYGWSEYNPAPRTLEQQAYELHTLLVNANEPGPYILVGHSYGARVARVYAAKYLQDVVGMALMDPGVLYDDPRYPQEALSEQEAENRMIRTARKLTPFGVVRILQPITGGPIYDLPEKANLANKSFGGSEKYWKSLVDQTDLLPDIFIEERNVTTLGNIPLLMLISTEPRDTKHQAYTQANIEMAGLSTNGRYQIVEGATHMSLAFRKEDAQVCTDGILSILEAVRSENTQ
jgi:pimeloyl-ACP methyl ester carboxylesterase